MKRLHDLRALDFPGPRLNVGCGPLPLKSFFNVDISSGVRIDYVVDVDHDDLPFGAGTVNVVLASHVFDHLAHIERFLSNVHRVLRPGGRLEVFVPYGRNRNLEHVRFLYPRAVRQYAAASNRWSLEFCHAHRTPPFEWHAAKYLGWDVDRWTLFWFLGRRRELHFMFRKKGDA